MIILRIMPCHVRSLQSLGIEGENYGALSPIIMERLPSEFKLAVSRNIKQDVWDLNNLLKVVNEEILARENCVIPLQRNVNLNKTGYFNEGMDLCTSSSLFSNNKNNQKLFCVYKVGGQKI